MYFVENNLFYGVENKYYEEQILFPC